MRLSRTWRLWFVLLILVISAADFALADDEEDNLEQSFENTEQELDQIERKISEHHVDLRELRRQEGALLDQIENIDGELDEQRSAFYQAEVRLRQAKTALKRANNQLRAAQSGIEEHDKSLRKRLRAIYKFGMDGPMQVLFSSDSLNDLAGRMMILNRLISHDRRLIKRYRKQRQNYLAKKKRAEKQLKLLSVAEDQVERRKKIVETRRTQREELLEAIGHERELKMAMVRELQSARADLEHMISGIEDDEDNSSWFFSDDTFEDSKGTLPFPVRGRVLSTYGEVENPRFGTITFNKGVDLAASYGTTVKAVFAGRVVYAGWFRGYGNIVIIDHGENYYTLSAHLSELRVKVAQRVKAGKSIGEVGDTGLLGRPSLYFEVRHRENTVNPLDWLEHN
jgi:murein hydrolase activator